MEPLEECEIPTFVPTKEDRQRLAILRAAGHVTKIVPFACDPPPKYEQNTTSDKVKVFCSKCHRQFTLTNERKAHICEPIGHTWIECIVQHGGFYGGHPEERLRRENEKFTYNKNKKTWDSEETSRYTHDKKLWDWHLLEDRRKNTEIKQAFRFASKPLMGITTSDPKVLVILKYGTYFEDLIRWF
jgi:hypothetical protein